MRRGDTIMEKRNAYFQLQIKEDGTYIQIFPEVNGGNKPCYEDINLYFRLIQLENYDKYAIRNGLQTCNSEVLIKILPEHIHLLDEMVYVSIDTQQLHAYARFYPPVIDARTGAMGRTLRKDDILQILVRNGIKAGIIDSTIDTFLSKRRYNHEICIAQGRAPVQGHNGRIEYHFTTNHCAKPRINEDGTVDYRQLDLIHHVEKGDKLATIHPEVPGKAGMLVSGKVEQPARVKTPRFKYGKNIAISEDGRYMYAEVAGHVYLIEDKVFVGNTYEVMGNVDASTGNIEFNGDIHITGNVTSGYSLKASGHIIVDGVVEGSVLEADGPIVVKGGIQGSGKAYIKAGGSVTTKFIEHAKVESNENVYAEAILHSVVSAKNEIEVKGKKGLVIGGEIRAGASITLKVAGSMMGAFTLVEVGIDPMVLKEIKENEKELQELAKEKASLGQLALAFKQKMEKGFKLNEYQVQALQTVSSRLQANDRKTKELLYRREELEIQISRSKEGTIIVEDRVFGGVKIVISSAIMIVKNEISYCRMEKSGEDVMVIPR